MGSIQIEKFLQDYLHVRFITLQSSETKEKTRKLQKKDENLTIGQNKGIVTSFMHKIRLLLRAYNVLPFRISL